jgi:hypothetical protein
MPGGRDDLDRRPAASNGRCQLQAIHGTRHLYVGKNDANIRAALQQVYRFFGVSGLYDIKACFLYYLHRIHAQQKFVLDDKYDEPLGHCEHFELPPEGPSS